MDEWLAEVHHHLEIIDRLLPSYAAMVEGEPVVIAYQVRVLTSDYTLEENPAMLRDIALRAASLFYAFDGALSEGNPS